MALKCRNDISTDMFYIIVLTSLEKLIEVEIWFKSLKFKHRGVGCGRAASLTVQEIFLFINHRQTRSDCTDVGVQPEPRRLLRAPGTEPGRES